MSIYRLSHSSMQLLHSCERLFQLERLLLSSSKKTGSPATTVGTAFGVGVASYLQDQSLDNALFAAWKAYFPRLEDEKRTQEAALHLLISGQATFDTLLLDWELAYFQGKPAAELSFRLNINPKFYYVGYVDLVMRNKWTGRLSVFEVKTTSMGLFDLAPLYQNSPQALAYSIVLDRIAGEEHSEYDVNYLVAQLNSRTAFSPSFKVYPFKKTLQDRLDWFITLGMDVKRIEEMMETGLFPKRGEACLRYMRSCQHFGTCQLHGFDEEIVPEADSTDYQFNFDLPELVAEHIQRLATKKRN